MDARVVRFAMASERSAVAPAVDRILRAARPAGLSDEQRDNLAVAAAEALSNAAVHGHRLDRRRKVQVAVEVIAGRRATIEVTDDGSGFDVTALADPTEPSRRLIPGGRGVFLMKRLVDHVEFNEKGNMVRLVVEARPK
ncbi:MAG TPA: ATP-binding protein [Vicinamibacteria bacterium]|nr:ATP-binding protein [Vicinamibacteria bacterium]